MGLHVLQDKPALLEYVHPIRFAETTYANTWALEMGDEKASIHVHRIACAVTMAYAHRPMNSVFAQDFQQTVKHFHQHAPTDHALDQKIQVTALWIAYAEMEYVTPERRSPTAP